MKKSLENIRLNYIKKAFSNTDSNLIIGIEDMDDAAVYRTLDQNYLVIASDFIRGSGFYLFQKGYLNYFDIGYYLVVANISDIAAMGVKPTGLTTILRYQSKMSDDDFKEILDGISLACKEYGVFVIGGDTGGYELDVFGASAFGLSLDNRFLQRKNVKNGDIVCVSGEIGTPITALVYFTKLKNKGVKLTKEEEEELLNSWKRPKPQVKLGVLLNELGFVNACMDVSDGLKASIEQLSSISSRFMTIDESSLPINHISKKLGEIAGLSATSLAMSASVDFQLLFTLPEDSFQECFEACKKNGIKISRIGKVNSLKENNIQMVSGETKPLVGISWKHQEDDFLQSIIKQSSK